MTELPRTSSVPTRRPALRSDRPPQRWSGSLSRVPVPSLPAREFLLLLLLLLYLLASPLSLPHSSSLSLGFSPRPALRSDRSFRCRPPQRWSGSRPRVPASPLTVREFLLLLLVFISHSSLVALLFLSLLFRGFFLLSSLRFFLQRIRSAGGPVPQELSRGRFGRSWAVDHHGRSRVRAQSPGVATRI